MPETNFYHISLAGELERQATLEDALKSVRNGGFIWLNYCDPSREELERLIEPLNVHPLAIEDCTDQNQIPKIEDYPGHSFILFNGFDYSKQRISIYEIDLLIGEKFLVTVSRSNEDGEPYLHGMERFVLGDAESCREGPSFLAHVFLDAVVDRKFTAIEALEDELNAAEDTILENSANFRPATLLDLRRELLLLRKSLFHEREILVKINRGDCRYVSSKALLYFRDVYDHLTKFFELTESYREIETSLMEMYLSMLSNTMAQSANETNVTVRRLTFITTIFMPLSFLAGVGGMSEFSMMTGPDNWRIAYPLFLVTMVVLGVGSYYLLKLIERKRD